MSEVEASSLLQERSWNVSSKRMNGNIKTTYWYRERDNRCLQMLVNDEKVITLIETTAGNCGERTNSSIRYDDNPRQRYSNSDDGITLYSDCGYRGNSRTLGVGRFDVDEMGIGNDNLSCLRIPPGYTVTLYNDTDFRGSSKSFNRDISCLNEVGWNDRASSLRVSRGSGREVTLYRDCGFNGSNKSLREGNYDMDQLGVGNDNISALEIPPGYSVTLYSDSRFRGSSKTFYEDIQCLGDFGWNDKASSIRIRRERR